MSNLERTHYTLAYEDGQLIRRGKKRIRGHEITTYTNYSNFPKHMRGDVALRLLIEVAHATNSDPKTVREKILKNYEHASDTIFQNARNGIYTHVPVIPITYTIDPRRKPIHINNAPIMSSMN